MVRGTDRRPTMTIAVDLGRKAKSKQTKGVLYKRTIECVRLKVILTTVNTY